MSNASSANPYIPMDTSETLWEWDVASDDVYFSEGLINLLKLPIVPKKMIDFYKFVPHDYIVNLISVRKNVISGKSNFVRECDYICNNIWVHEHLITLRRDNSGIATRIMGRIASTPFSEYNVLNNFSNNYTGNLYETGVWICDARNGKIWIDRLCSSMLGYNEMRRHPMSIRYVMRNVHSSERHALKRHYELFCKNSGLGEIISDIVHLRHANGEYRPVLLRASIVETDKAGKAAVIAGLMTYNNLYAFKNSCLKDDKLLYALSSMSSGQWNWDIANDVLYACPQYQAMLGYQPTDSAVFAKMWSKLIHPDDYPKVMRMRESVVHTPKHGDSFECTYRMRCADGGWAWIFDRGCVIWRDSDGRAGQVVGSIINITTAQDERDKLEELVSYDTLTGLRSRAFYNLEFDYLEQKSVRPVCALSLDVTGLKMINDNLGHAKGDELLIKAATLLRNSLRSSDCVARKGGDEFIVLLPHCNVTRGRKLAAKIEKVFENYNAEEGNMPVFLPCGVAAAETVDDSLSDAIALADEEMYHKKKEMREKAYARIKDWIRARTGREVKEDDRLC